MNTIKPILLQLLRTQFCHNDLTGTSNQNVWVMMAAIAPFSLNHITTESYSGEPPSHTVRIVLRTTDEDGTNEYVDGTDIFVSIDDKKQSVAFTWEDLWIEGPPIFHGGSVTYALKWVWELSEPFYIQLHDPYLTPEQRVALNGHSEDLELPL